MSKPSVSDFSLPWCQSLLTSPLYTIQPLNDRRPPLPQGGPPPNALTARGLNSPSTIGAWQCLVAKSATPPNVSPELLLLLSLGPDLAGYKAIMHGGIYGMLIDQVTGMIAVATFGFTAVTRDLRVRYLRPLKLPAVVLVRSVVVKREGRRADVSCSVEDGEGGVYATGEAVYVIKGGPSLL